MSTDTHSIECKECHRPLEVPKSVDRGVGPECFKGYSHKALGKILNNLSSQNISDLPNNEIEDLRKEVAFLKNNATGVNKSYYDAFAIAEKDLVSYLDTKDTKYLTVGLDSVKACFELFDTWKKKENAKQKCPSCKRAFVNLNAHKCKKLDALVEKYKSRINDAYSVNEFKELKDNINQSQLKDEVKNNLITDIDNKIKNKVSQLRQDNSSIDNFKNDLEREYESINIKSKCGGLVPIAKMNKNLEILGYSKDQIQNSLAQLKQQGIIEQIGDSITWTRKKLGTDPDTITTNTKSVPLLPVSEWINTDENDLRGHLANYDLKELKKEGAMYLKSSEKN